MTIYKNYKTKNDEMSEKELISKIKSDIARMEALKEELAVEIDYLENVRTINRAWAAAIDKFMNPGGGK